MSARMRVAGGALGATFVYAAATKLPDMAAFAEEVANYRLLPAALVPAAAAALVGVELLLGALLLLGIWTRAAALLAAALLALFSAALSAALARGIDLRCGCFGGSEPATWGTVGRDLLLLAVAAAIAVAAHRPSRPGAPPTAPAGSTGAPTSPRPDPDPAGSHPP